MITGILKTSSSMGRGVGGISATNAEGLGGTCFGKTRFKISDGIRLLKYKYPPEPARIRIRNKKNFPAPDFFFTRWSNTEFMNENDNPKVKKRIQLVTSDASNHSFGPVELQSPKLMNIMKFISANIIELPCFPLILKKM